MASVIYLDGTAHLRNPHIQEHGETMCGVKYTYPGHNPEEHGLEGFRESNLVHQAKFELSEFKNMVKEKTDICNKCEVDSEVWDDLNNI